MRRVQSAALLTLCLTSPLPKAAAESVVVEAGKTHTLTADLVLNGDDVLDIRGTADKPCVLVGNRHRIRSGPKWTGTLRITHCTIRDLGGWPAVTKALFSPSGAFERASAIATAR